MNALRMVMFVLAPGWDEMDEKWMWSGKEARERSTNGEHAKLNAPVGFSGELEKVGETRKHARCVIETFDGSDVRPRTDLAVAACDSLMSGLVCGTDWDGN